MASNANAKLLDDSGKPIALDGRKKITLSNQGEFSQEGRNVDQLGIYDTDPAALQKQGSNLLAYPDSAVPSLSKNYTLHQKFVERSNVEPATELTQLMDAERQLEANANMIKTQDETLGELVNSVAKIS
jgi:flagellar basal-body rod protein FlgG